MNLEQSRLRQVRRALYKFKRKWGVRLSIYAQTNATVNYTTGARAVTRSAIHLQRAVVLPVRRIPKFAYDLTWVASNKNFTYGAYFQTGDRDVIIDGQDLPRGYTLDNNSYVVYQGDRYDIKEIREIEPKFGYYLSMRKTQEVKPYQLINSSFVQFLTFSETYTGEVTV